MNLTQCAGAWGLVSGASSGIGREFCVQLAAAGMNLVLVARREAILDEFADELRTRHGIATRVIAADLAREEAAAEIQARLTREGIAVRLLCNNAAFGRWGRFEQTEAEVYCEMIRLNTSAMVSLCHRLLPALSSHPSSVVINVSSPAAYQPIPYMAVYAASKAFVHSFSQALYGEWRARGVLVQTLVPGPTDTEFDAKAGAYDSALKTRASPAEVVRTALAHLGQDQPVVAAAKGLFKQRFFAGVFPPRTVIEQVGRMFRPPEER